MNVFRDHKDIYPHRCDYYPCQKLFKADSVPFVHWHLGFKTYWCTIECSKKADKLRSEL